MASPLGVRFWGTRGLVSCPGKETAKYGGNTPCIQILHREALVVVDAGFGITNLGEQLLAARDQRPIHIFFTHMHWDHIQGLPFFHPIYSADAELHLHSPLKAEQLYRNLDVLFDGSYSPFEGIDSMPASIKFHQLKSNLSLTGDLAITFTKVNHGHEHNQHGSTWGYRFSCQNHAIALITDHEAEPAKANRPVIEFCKNADLLIHDAQYTAAEYPAHRGWGHSTPQMAIQTAHAAGAGRLLMTHHDPRRTDAQMDHLTNSLVDPAFPVEFAQEGQDYWVVKHTKTRDAG